MEDSEIKKLLIAFANYYRSVPVSLVRENIMAWHPEITPEQFDRVLDDVAVKHPEVKIVSAPERVPEPELVMWHMSDSEHQTFAGDRLNLSFASRSEEEILKGGASDDIRLDIPEAQAFFSFLQSDLGLDDKKARLTVSFVRDRQEQSFWFQESWVTDFLDGYDAKGELFSTVEQVKRFRDLANSMYQNLPNPFLRGWKPAEVENPPELPDELPRFIRLKTETVDLTKKPKVGRNDPCPCGSGKKYKKCCGR